MIILSGESQGNFPAGRMAVDQISSLAEGCFASPYYFACWIWQGLWLRLSPSLPFRCQSSGLNLAKVNMGSVSVFLHYIYFKVFESKRWFYGIYKSFFYIYCRYTVNYYILLTSFCLFLPFPRGYVQNPKHLNQHLTL